MRKYEAAALLPDLSIHNISRTAPADPIFEEAGSAFARGTLFQTVGGPVAVEDLLPGDYIQTANGSEPIHWIGSTNYVPRVEDSDSILTTLYRVTAAAFGLESPASDMIFGPSARVLVRRDAFRSVIGHDAVFVPLADFADGERIIPIQPGGSVQMFHVGLRRHGVLKIGGMELESYHPGPGLRRSLGADRMETFLSLFPNITRLSDLGELSYPRTSRDAAQRLCA
ncbi:Hint domain-containing protein [Roseivivax lentus]|uniref:Hint domain-containing protein n=1 Tax=Roseivivax lentus TaxID=633194 RepID=A0A1N7L007_9RHOB|nr:Hint domain-containing protein [Roseivivax lentus]SIS67096.1 Hint domain-containing protein [Roseivivax lentus]